MVPLGISGSIPVRAIGIPINKYIIIAKMLLDNHNEEIDEDSEASNEDNEGGNIAKKRNTKEDKLFFRKIIR